MVVKFVVFPVPLTDNMMFNDRVQRHMPYLLFSRAHVLRI
jgi:hypothetical protein